MPKFNKNKNKSKKPYSGPQKELSASASLYRGPIVTGREKLNQSTHTVVMSLTGLLQSDSGGVVTPLAVSSDPTGAVNWSNFAACFDEYRVLGMQFEYYPNDRYDPGLTQHQRPLAVVVDNNGNAALGSYAAAANYESLQMKSTSDPFKRVCNMSSLGEAQFFNTGISPLDQFYIKFYAQGLAVSSEYGRWILHWRVQFRGHAT